MRCPSHRRLVLLWLALLALPSVTASQSPDLLPGMPPLLDPHDVYAANRRGI